MGSDIHSLIEYKKHDSDSGFWDFVPGEMSIPRDYRLFSALGLAEDETSSPFAPRGLPFDCSARVRESFFDDADSVKEILSMMRDGDVSDEEAVDEYISEIGGCAADEYRVNDRLPNVDYYGPSWLHYPELLKAVEDGKLNLTELSDEFRAVLQTLRELTDQYGIENVRFVFWFDGAG